MSVQWRRLILATIWSFQVLIPSTANDLACKFGDSCCKAQRAYRDAEALGGCRTAKLREKNSRKCKEADWLCKDCQQKSADKRNAHSGATSNRSQLVNLTKEGVLLATFTGDDLEMRCVSAEAPDHCGLGDLGILIVFLAGVVLLVGVMSAAMLFDSYCLPFLVLRFSRSWLAPYVDVEDPRSPFTSSTHDAEIFTDLPASHQSLRELAADTSSSVQAAIKPEAPPYPKRKLAPPPLGAAIELPASPRLLENTCTGSPVAADGDMLAPGIAVGHPVNVSSPTKAVLEHSVGRSEFDHMTSARSTSSVGRGWPARLARLWAFRVAFLSVASIAVFARLVHITLAAIITFDRSAVVVSVELAACLVPYAWVALTSRPPPDNSYGVPQHIGYICGRLPRFSIFVILTLAVETYCAILVAMAVASKSCDDPPWRNVVIYAGDVPVVVARIYSALLAIRLQDRLSQVARKVLPDFRSAKVPTKALERRKNDASLNFTDLTNIEPEEEPDVESTLRRSPKVVGRVEVARPIEELTDLGDDHDMKAFHRPRRASKPDNERIVGGTFCSWFCWSSSRSLDDRSRPSSPESPSSEASSQNKLVSRFRKRLRIRSNMAIALTAGLLLALAAGSISIWVSHLGQVDETDPPPSSCTTSQNATATCAHFESVGAWDSSAHDFESAGADTMQDCCRGCDGQKDCQAWMFESVAKSCRWIRFLEDPCVANPGDLRCRCVTHFGTSFGFKPTSQVVWVKREGID